MDYINITSIRAYGYIGFLPEEKVLGQWFEVDLTLGVDLAQAGKTDDLEDTLDYRDAIARTKNLIQTAKFALIERLAAAIAESLLELEKVEFVRVKLIKPAAPIPDFGGNIAVEIERFR